MTLTENLFAQARGGKPNHERNGWNMKQHLSFKKKNDKLPLWIQPSRLAEPTKRKMKKHSTWACMDIQIENTSESFGSHKILRTISFTNSRPTTTYYYPNWQMKTNYMTFQVEKITSKALDFKIPMLFFVKWKWVGDPLWLMETLPSLRFCPFWPTAPASRLTGNHPLCPSLVQPQPRKRPKEARKDGILLPEMMVWNSLMCSVVNFITVEVVQIWVAEWCSNTPQLKRWGSECFGIEPKFVPWWFGKGDSLSR